LNELNPALEPGRRGRLVAEQRKTRILHLEDSALDAELVEALLSSEVACEIVRVDTREGFEAALATGGFDVILSDYSLPGFGGPAALALARQSCPDVPYLFVSGSIGEDRAIETLRGGATDYVLKDRLSRLAPAVRRALEEAADRRRRQEAEKALYGSEIRSRAILDAAGDGIYGIDHEGRITFVNPAAARMLGYAPDELIGLNSHAVLHHSRADGTPYSVADCPVDAAVRAGLARDVTNEVFWHKDGSCFPVDYVSTPLGEGGKPAGAVVAFRDITERRRAEEALASERRLLKVVLDSVDAGIVACDSGGGLTLFNRAAREWHGLPEEPLPDERWAEHYDLFESDGKTRMTTQQVPLFRTLLGEDVRNVEMMIVPKHAPARRLLASGQPIVDAAGRRLGAVVAMIDVTELKRSEEELGRQREVLYQSEKLAAMGTLLASVAHELNNPLAVVVGQANLLRRAAGEGPLAARADKIEKAAERCARIVANFLALARQRPPERQRVMVNNVVREALELLAYSLRMDNIELQLELAASLPPLWADPHQLHQVIVNLVTNAQHALRGKASPRRIGVTTRLCPNGRLILEVADSGSGMVPDVRDRIFEPFFTTKKAGEGTGLGLPLCRGIIEGHGGTMSVDSEPGEGAVFQIELPVHQAEPLPPERATAAARRVGPRSILVVDDELDVADVLADFLRSQGHAVDTARGGLAGVDKLRARAYDLVISDVKMPDLDGPGLLREAARLDPRLPRRFLFVTGDGLSPETRRYLAESGVPTLAKPFDLAEALRLIHATLGDASSS
jgi:PAS domain S-box-containing protein